MKTISLNEYLIAGEEFWPKYWYVAKELGENAKSEDILKIMESLAGVAMKNRAEEKTGPFGFNKKSPTAEDESSTQE
jgi:hypothetical protein